MDPEERKQAWLAFASAATCGRSAWSDGEGGVLPVEDVVLDAGDIADDMLEEYENRFGGGAKRPRQRKRKEDDR